MIEEAAHAIVSSGSPVLGAILVVLGYAYHKQGQSLAAVQESRVADAKKVAETLLSMQDRWQAVVSELTEAVQKFPGGRR